MLADIGSNLRIRIRSQQDTDDFASKQQQASGKVVVGYGGSASGSYNQSNVDSHYASVTTVSGIAAGGGGYNIHVGGNTDLKGGVIASTADAAKNVLDTGSLTFSDIKNNADYSASSFGVNGGTAGGSKGVSPNIGIPQSDDSHNVTKAGIANGTIITRSGSTDLSGLDSNATLDQQSLEPIFDQQKVQERQEMGQVAGYVGFRAAGDIAGKMGWAEGSTERTILHGVVGAGVAALGGGDAVGGAVGASANQVAINKMAEFLVAQGYEPTSAEFSTMLQLGSAALGLAVGGGSGAATALDGTQHNYLTHQQVDAVNEALSKCGADESCKSRVIVATEELSKNNDIALSLACQSGDNSCAPGLGSLEQYIENKDVPYTLRNDQKTDRRLEQNEYFGQTSVWTDLKTIWYANTPESRSQTGQQSVGSILGAAQLFGPWLGQNEGPRDPNQKLPYSLDPAAGMSDGMQTGYTFGQQVGALGWLWAGDAAFPTPSTAQPDLRPAGRLDLSERVRWNVAQSSAETATSNFGAHSSIEGSIQDALGLWPPSGGAYAPTYNTTLSVGAQLDRFGYPGGSYLSPLGDSFSGRALPPSYQSTKPYFQYEVVQPIPGVTEAKALPWFGQQGSGTQYQLPNSVQWYLDNGYLKATSP